MIFGQGFLPLALDNLISNCQAAVIGLVHPGYFISPVPTISGEEKGTSKKNVDGRSTSSHDNKKFRTRSVEKQRGMAFGFRKTATAVVKPDR